MKIWNSEHVFEHPWETVVHAAWRKYPNPINPAVKSMDVTSREISNDGTLRTTRILSTEFNIPGWVTRLIGVRNPSYVYEYSEVSSSDKTMTLKSVNMNGTNFVSIDETLTYKPHPEDQTKTLLEQSAAVSVRGVPLIAYCESLMTSSISANAQKGRQAMEWVISNIKSEYEEISSKIASECQGITLGVRQSVDELKREIDDVVHPHQPNIV
jgi:hypothetical protein